MVVKVQVTDPSKANPRKIPSAIFLVFFFIKGKSRIIYLRAFN